MALMDCVKLWKKAVSVDVLAKLLWTLEPMLEILLGRCILVLWRTEKCLCWVQLTCGRNGTRKQMIGFESGSVLERLEGKLLENVVKMELTGR